MRQVGFIIYNQSFHPISKETIGGHSDYLYEIYEILSQLGAKLFYIRQHRSICVLSHFHYGDPKGKGFAGAMFYQKNIEPYRIIEAKYKKKLEKLPFIQSARWDVRDSIDRDEGVLVIRTPVKIV